MESKSKKMKNQEKREENCDLDRLSCLPDSILTHILSFIDTKSVVRTSVLSKRYKPLWTFSPCLDFKLFPDRLIPQGKNFSDVSFKSFVSHVLQFRRHYSLVSFRLSLHTSVDLEFILNCIDYAVRHQVQHLGIRVLVKEKPIALPTLLLNSSSLITLHLHNATSNCIELPKSVDLPKLKFLSLKNFEFSDRNFDSEVFSGCPNLETLILSKCCIRPVNKLKILDVNCLNLKNLEIKNWRSPWKCFDEHMINVNAPRLAVLKFQGHLVKLNFREALLCLEKAFIDLCYPTACFMMDARERKQRTSGSFLNILRHICNVKFLSLSLKTIEVLCAAPDLHSCAPIIFENLRVLKFTAENKYREKAFCIDGVTQLLESIASDVLIFDGSKGKKVLPGSSNAKAKEDSRHFSIPAHVMRFLLENSPAAEYLIVEIPNLSSDQECGEKGIMR